MKVKVILITAAAVAALTLTNGVGVAQLTAPASTTIIATNYGARGDAVNDDRPALQSALDALAARGGGTLRVPSGTYLLNSYSPSSHPWYFYNLRVSSNVTIQADTGAKFLQGPGGRAPLSRGADQVGTSVLVFGSRDYASNTFQQTQYNGGFHSIQATIAGDTQVILSSPSDVGRFKAGDYVAIYSTSTGISTWTGNIPDQLVPSESTQVVSVNPSGSLTLKYPLARSFPSAIIANVTSLVTVNVGVNNLIIQGTEPLVMNEVFNFVAAGNTFITEVSIGGGNDFGFSINNTRGFQFSHNLITSTGSSYMIVELPQRNSQDVTIDSNIFEASSVRFGEFAAHWKITGNTFALHPETLTSGAGVAFGGQDVLFMNNHVQGNTALVPLIADWIGTSFYGPYVGNIRIIDNTVDCRADQANCLNIAGSDTIVQGNKLNVTGNTASAILVEGAPPQGVVINRNYISVRSGIGIALNTPPFDKSTISCNTINGPGLIGIYVSSSSTPNQGSGIIAGNTVVGFGKLISIDSAKHPGTSVSYSTQTCGP